MIRGGAGGAGSSDASAYGGKGGDVVAYEAEINVKEGDYFTGAVGRGGGLATSTVSRARQTAEFRVPDFLLVGMVENPGVLVRLALALVVAVPVCSYAETLRFCWQLGRVAEVVEVGELHPLLTAVVKLSPLAWRLQQVVMGGRQEELERRQVMAVAVAGGAGGFSQAPVVLTGLMA